jgi:hypothetical protein
MNVRTILLWGIIIVLMLLSGCTNASAPDQSQITPIPTKVSGVVIRNDNLTPIANALVFDIAGLARDTSKSDGKFGMVYQLLAQTKTTIVGSRSGFGNDTAFVTLNPGVDTTITLRLKADSSSPSGPVSSGKAANIVLIASSGENISIRGTGSNETALLTFEVRDSLGIPIGGSNKLTVNFSILGGPGGGEYVFPPSATTDALTGRVSTRVNSGTKAGVLQVFATATVTGVPLVTIKSSPVKITISGGLPVADHFSVSRKPLNIAGGVYDNLRAQIMVIAGDKDGNPVQQGTAVSFSTTGGIIQPNAITDKDGIATVDLISGNPRPANSVAVVTATTIGDSGTVIRKSASVLFSGATRILTPASTIVIPDSGSASFTYRVQDPNGFPLVVGTSIAVTVDGPGAGQLKLFGDVAKNLEDTDDPNSTTFKVTVSDNILKGPAGNVTFKISVTSQNGNASATFPGLVLADTSTKPPIETAVTSGYASSLVLVGTPTQNVSVRGTGANETSIITFAALDSVGNPVELRRRAYVTFSVTPFGGVGGGEFLYPAADSTNAYGQVATTFNAGTRSGVLQVVAVAHVNGRTITSSPVKLTISSGLPDLAHFTAAISPSNMPGWNGNPGVKVGTVSVQVGDKFGNPVQLGTALYFTTSGGIIQATAFTDADGQAKVSLFGGNPLPNDNGAGFGHVTATTVGEGGTSIQKAIPFLFSGSPTVVLLNVPNDTVKVFDGSSVDIDYSVSDQNGNPLSAGHGISVSVSGSGAAGVRLSGDIAVQTTDTQDKVNFTKYRFRVADAFPNADPSGELVFTISVSGDNGTYVRKFYGTLFPPQVTTIVPVSARQPSQIAFLGITTPDLYVAGVGNTENTVITYEVHDSLGVPITKAVRAYATFNIQFFPNSSVGGGTPPTLIPNADSTDDAGKLRASIVSGTEAGVIQIVARIALSNGNVIVSQPVKVTVHAGFPDRAHFSFMTNRFVFPGFDGYVPGVPPVFTVVVGDTFSNPVQSNTAIYFHSQAGIITTGSGGDLAATYTNSLGIASSQLMTVNPKPNAVPFYDPTYGRLGYHWVWAQTQGKGGLWIIDSVLLVWNRAPIIVTGIPNAVIPIPRGGTSQPISVTITDANGNPLCDNTSIAAIVTFTSDVVGVKFGVSGDLTDVAPFSMPVAGYARFPGPGVTFFTFNVSDLSTNGGASVGQSILVQLVITAPALQTRIVSFVCQVQ